MAKVGRKFQGNIFKQKNKDGSFYGSYRVYDPIQKKPISLDTEDENEAKAKVQSMFGHLIDSAFKQISPPKRVMPLQHKVVDLDGGVTAPKDTAPIVGADESIPIQYSQPEHVGSAVASSVLSDWAAQNPPEPSSIPLNQPPNLRVVEGEKVSEPIVTKTRKKAGNWSDADIAKMASGMHKIVANANMLVLDLCVRSLGKVPYQPSEDELELLAMGWEMYLNEYFAKSPPQPWMLILAGNLLVGFAMYTQGQALPPKDKVPTEVKG